MSATETIVENTPYRIVDEDGYRKLMVQGSDGSAMSVMQIEAPDNLVFQIFESMMKFLAFSPRPKDVVLIGLGGGQQAKFIHKRMPETRLVAVEIDPAIVRIARSYFCLPEDDDRLQVIVGDGKDYIQNHPGSCDVILSDGYDQTFTVSDSLIGEDYYRACYRALRKGGIMAINIYRMNEEECRQQLKMVMRFFSYYMQIQVSEEQFALLVFKDSPDFDWPALIARADENESRFGLKLPGFLREAKNFIEKGN